MKRLRKLKERHRYTYTHVCICSLYIRKQGKSMIVFYNNVGKITYMSRECIYFEKENRQVE